MERVDDVVPQQAKTSMGRGPVDIGLVKSDEVVGKLPFLLTQYRGNETQPTACDWDVERTHWAWRKLSFCNRLILQRTSGQTNERTSEIKNKQTSKQAN